MNLVLIYKIDINNCGALVRFILSIQCNITMYICLRRYARYDILSEFLLQNFITSPELMVEFKLQYQLTLYFTLYYKRDNQTTTTGIFIKKNHRTKQNEWPIYVAVKHHRFHRTPVNLKRSKSYQIHNNKYNSLPVKSQTT